MTVQELIDQLQQIEDKTLPVYADGCDCLGVAGRAVVDNGAVIVVRKANLRDYEGQE